jgi:hypothetical protein
MGAKDVSTVQISNNPTQYLASALQSVMSSSPFSGISSDTSSGQDVQGGSASSSAAVGSLASSVPSLQLSSDLLTSLISLQAGASSGTDTDQTDPTQTTARHHHHGAAAQSPSTETSADPASAATAAQDVSGVDAAGQSAASGIAASISISV